MNRSINVVEKRRHRPSHWASWPSDYPSPTTWSWVTSRSKTLSSFSVQTSSRSSRTAVPLGSPMMTTLPSTRTTSKHHAPTYVCIDMFLCCDRLHSLSVVPYSHGDDTAFVPVCLPSLILCVPCIVASSHFAIICVCCRSSVIFLACVRGIQYMAVPPTFSTWFLIKKLQRLQYIPFYEIPTKVSHR